MLLGLGLGAAAQELQTLREYLEAGLERNYDIRIIRNEERISDNNATAANAGKLPTIDLSAGYTGRLDNDRTTPRGGRPGHRKRDLQPDVRRRTGGELDPFRRLPHPRRVCETRGAEGQGRPADPADDRGVHRLLHGRILQLRAAEAAPGQLPLRHGPLARTAAHRRRVVPRGQFGAARRAPGPRGLQCRQFAVHVAAGGRHRLAHPPQRTAGQRGARPETQRARLADRHRRRPGVGTPHDPNPRDERLAAAGRPRQHDLRTGTREHPLTQLPLPETAGRIRLHAQPLRRRGRTARTARWG